MPYITSETEVWVDIEEFDDEEIMDEVERRKIGNSKKTSSTSIQEAISCWQRKNYTEAMFQLEQAFPELDGLYSYSLSGQFPKSR
tara:strand:- start:10 stop:264 length:255 start_codon:yes stop_codon:yes gene_type:complete